MGENTNTRWVNMKVPADAKARADEAKEDGETWGEYLLRCAERHRMRQTTRYPASELEQTHKAVMTIEERTGRIESMLESMGGR